MIPHPDAGPTLEHGEPTSPNAEAETGGERRTAPLNLSNLACRAASEMIRDKRLKGGDIVVEPRPAEALGVSRTPLREALQRLKGEGLVLKAANRSFVIRHVGLAEYLQSLKVCQLLEPEAAALSVGRIAPERLIRVPCLRPARPPVARPGVAAFDPSRKVHCLRRLWPHRDSRRPSGGDRACPPPARLQAFPVAYWNNVLGRR